MEELPQDIVRRIFALLPAQDKKSLVRACPLVARCIKACDVLLDPYFIWHLMNTKPRVLLSMLKERRILVETLERDVFISGFRFRLCVLPMMRPSWDDVHADLVLEMMEMGVDFKGDIQNWQSGRSALWFAYSRGFVSRNMFRERWYRVIQKLLDAGWTFNAERDGININKLVGDFVSVPLMRKMIMCGMPLHDGLQSVEALIAAGRDVSRKLQKIRELLLEFS